MQAAYPLAPSKGLRLGARVCRLLMRRATHSDDFSCPAARAAQGQQWPLQRIITSPPRSSHPNGRMVAWDRWRCTFLQGIGEWSREATATDSRPQQRVRCAQERASRQPTVVDGMAVRPSHPQRRHQRTVTPRPRLSSPPGGAVLVGSGRASPPLSWDNSSVPATCLVGRVSGSPLGRVEGIPRGQQKDQSPALPV